MRSIIRILSTVIIVCVVSLGGTIGYAKWAKEQERAQAREAALAARAEADRINAEAEAAAKPAPVAAKPAVVDNAASAKAAKQAQERAWVYGTYNIYEDLNRPAAGVVDVTATQVGILHWKWGDRAFSITDVEVETSASAIIYTLKLDQKAVLQIARDPVGRRLGGRMIVDNRVWFENDLRKRP